MEMLVVFVLIVSVKHCRAASHCADGTIVGMASPGSMVGGRDIRPTYGRGYLMTNAAYVSPCCGVVKAWTFAMDTLALPNPIEFHVWRPVNGNTYKLVGKNTYYAETSYPAGIFYYSDDESRLGSDSRFDDSGGFSDDESGYRQSPQQVFTVSIPANWRISIRASDVIGWRSPSGDLVSYTTMYYNLDNIIVNNMATVDVGATFVFPSTVSSHRTYGINAILTKGTAPFLTNLPASAQVRADDSEGSVVFNVTGSDGNPGDELIYVIPGTDDVPFKIDSKTGIVSVKARSALSKSSYNVRIAIADACGLYDMKILTVRVSGANVPPEIVGLPDLVTLPWTGGDRRLVHRLVVSDDDGDDVTCALTSVDPPSKLFFMNGTDVLVSTDPQSEVNANAVYNITVTCSDKEDATEGRFQVRFTFHRPPTIVNESATVSLSALDSHVGDIVYVIEAMHDGTAYLAFSAEDCSCPLDVHPDGSVVIRTSLKSEPVTSYTLQVYVTDGVVTVGPASFYFPLTDVNQAPVFENLPSSILVDENSSGTVLNVEATDPDGNTTVLSLTWSPPSASHYFVFNVSTSSIEIRENAALDFETLQIHNLTRMTAQLSASDGYKTSSAVVVVIVNDINEAPVCSQSQFYLTVEEGKKGGVIANNPIATSCSDPELLPLTFAIPSGTNSTTLFTINSKNASLIFATDIDVNVSTVTSFPVSVYDVGGLSVTVSLEVTIEAVNAVPLVVNLPRAMAVSENLPPGSDVFTVVTADDDADDDVILRFKVLQGDPELFELRGNTLILRSDRNLDFESASSFLVEFTADDGHVTSKPAVLTLDVLDINEAPRFEPDAFNITVEEGKTGETVTSGELFTSAVTDPDKDDTLTFSLLSHTDVFQINASTADVIFALDYDVDSDVMPSNLTLVVQVADSGFLSATASVQVQITNRNEPPAIVNLPREVTVREDEPPGTVVFRAKAKDPDGDAVQFHATFIEGSARYFSFNDTDGVFAVAESGLDFETTPRFTIEMSADDGVLTSQTMTLTLTVFDVNEPPRFLLDTLTLNAEEGPAGQLIADNDIIQIAHDPDTNDVLQFSLLPSNLSDYFFINSTSGQLYLARDYDADPERLPAEVTLIVQVRDSGGLSDSLNVTITMSNVNQLPVLDNLPADISVLENLETGSVVYKVTAHDRDTEDVVRFIAVVVEGRGYKFSFDAMNGTFILKQPLDYETEPFYRFRIAATDGDLTSSREDLNIYVIDVNEAPYFTRDHFHIRTQEGPAGTVVGDGGILSAARDPDNDPLIFDLVPTPGSSGFSIDTETAELIFAEDFVLPRGSPPVVVPLTIRVSDPGNLSVTAQVNVTISGVNSRPRLLFLPANITVSEEAVEGALLYRILAEDPDGDDLKFRLNTVLGGGQTMFDLDSATGELRLANGSSLKESTTAFYKLQLSVTDGSLSSEPANLGIIVLRGPDLPAVTSRPTYVISVSETELLEPLKLPEFWLAGDSLNRTAALTFNITGGSGEDFFSIDPDTGTLFFSGGFDIDDDPASNTTVTLEVTVSDNSERTKTAFVSITVLDVNDNAPEVTTDLVTLFVQKNSSVGSVIGFIEARDRDRGDNGALLFEITDSSLPSNAVQIKPSGALFVNTSLSSVAAPTGKLEVRVSDRGSPPLSTSVGVFIIFVGTLPGDAFASSSRTHGGIPGSSEAWNSSPKKKATDSGEVKAEMSTVATVTIVLLAVTVMSSAIAYVCGRRSARRRAMREQEQTARQPAVEAEEQEEMRSRL